MPGDGTRPTTNDRERVELGSFAPSSALIPYLIVTSAGSGTGAAHFITESNCEI